jgi:hypothetical protein
MEKTSGIGLMGILFIVFLVLKLTNFIDWSWLWITAPLWIPSALVVAIIILMMVISSIKFKRLRK